MSLPKIECINTDELIIKEELDPTEEGNTDSIFSTEAVLDDVKTYNAKCGEIFVSNEGNFLLICASCEKHFINMREFGEHIREEHLGVHPDASDNDQIDCKVFNDAEALTEVQPSGLVETTDNSNPDSESSKATTDPIVEEFQCEICNRQYKTKYTLNRHKLSHDELDRNTESKRSDANSKRRHCKFCGKKFNSQTKCLEHERVHTDERPYQCPHCPKSFKVQPHLNAHLTVHTGERPYECSYCSKRFKHSENLITHKRRIHLDIKNHPCEICGKRFVKKIEKEIHTRTHTGEKPFQCEECGKSFKIATQLNTHRKRHTNTRDYKCTICFKLFFSRELLRDHEVMHSSERPFACSICGRDFPRKKTLQIHEKLHSGVKEYVCNICGKDFAQYAGLYSHKKSHGIK